MTVNSDDLALVKKAQKGNKEAFQQLFCSGLIDYVTGYTYNTYNEPKYVVDELVSDALTRAMEIMSSFKGKSSFKVWVVGILKNIYKEHNKHKAKKRDREVSWEAVEPGIKAQLEKRQNEEIEHESKMTEEKEARLIKLHECIEKLPPEQKEIILLRLKGTPRKDIASLLDTTEARVRNLQYRAFKTLKSLVKMKDKKERIT